jgi:hypothetical protein
MNREAFWQEAVMTNLRFWLRAENVTKHLSGITSNMAHIFTV